MTLHELTRALGFGTSAARAMVRMIGYEGEALRVVALNEAVAHILGKSGHRVVRASLVEGKISLTEEAADAICLFIPKHTEEMPTLLCEAARVVRNRGLVVVGTPQGLARRGPPRSLVTALLLHAGLTDLKQSLGHGTLITAGRVQR